MEPEESCLIPARGFPCDACFPIFAIAHQLVVADANSQLARLVTDWVLASEVPPGSDVFEAEKRIGWHGSMDSPSRLSSSFVSVTLGNNGMSSTFRFR